MLVIAKSFPLLLTFAKLPIKPFSRPSSILKMASSSTNFSPKEMDALSIAEKADFKELLVGYNCDGKWVAMDTPRDPVYHKTDETGKIEEVINLKKIGVDRQKIPVEYRAITLRQLRAVVANIKRRCVAEKWTNYKGEALTPDMVTLYDVDKYVIRPFTVKTKKSFVSTLPSTAGTQPPRWFISHWWGEQVNDFVSCVETFVTDFSINCNESQDWRGGGMTADTPIWICAYANNQWDLSEITINPYSSSFTLAMKEADFRTLSILDSGGVVFTRIWCILEVYLALIYADKWKNDDSVEVWAVYTAFKNKHLNQDRDAVGIVNGGATSDKNNLVSSQREAHFPFELITKSLNLEVEHAKASYESDRVHILNAIVHGEKCENFDALPPEDCAAYETLNNAVRGAFASSQGILKRTISQQNSKVWPQLVSCLSKASTEDGMKFYFDEGLDIGWDDMTPSQAVELISHLPKEIGQLLISSASRFGSSFAVALGEWMKNSVNLKRLDLELSHFDDNGMMALLDGIQNCNSLEIIRLFRNELDEKHLEKLGDAVLGNDSIVTVVLSETMDEDMLKRKVDKLKEITRSRNPEVSIEVGKQTRPFLGQKSMKQYIMLNSSKKDNFHFEL